MITLIVALSVISALVGAIALYLASPNQKLRASPLAKRHGILIGSSTIAISLALLLQIAGTATAVFIVLTILMLAWSVPPLGVAYVQRSKGSKR